jgi:hypothetical protein
MLELRESFLFHLSSNHIAGSLLPGKARRLAALNLEQYRRFFKALMYKRTTGLLIPKGDLPLHARVSDNSCHG